MSESSLTHAFQYSSARHQSESAISGMWLFLATEVLFFGALFLSWIYSRHWNQSGFDLGAHCDVVTINCPLHPETEHLFNDAMISKMKRGAYIVNTARGKICDRDAIVRALESGQLAGYAGDVWFPQPAPKDHPWRSMPHHGMTPHISGTSLSAQTRYAAGTREILECYFEGRPIRDEYLVVDKGKLAGVGAHSYSAGNATGGSEEAAKFKKGA